MWMDLVAAAPDPSGLSVSNPLVLGPIAAFVFTVFVTEVVVSGKAYRREVAENTRLRALVEQVIPLAENMVRITTEVAAVSKRMTEVLQQALLDRERR